MMQPEQLVAVPGNAPKTGRSSSGINWLSWVTGSFMNSIITKAMRSQPLEESLILDQSTTVDRAFNSFYANWQKELDLLAGGQGDKKRRPKPSLYRALWRTFRKDILSAALLKLGWGVFILLSISFFLREILRAINVRSGKGGPLVGDTQDLNAEETGYILIAMFFVCTVMLSMCIQQMAASSGKLGLKMKSAVSTAVYRKTLTYDKYRNNTDIMSLVATDCSKLAESCTTLHYLWSGIVESVAIMGVLVGFFGRLALPGFGVLVLLLLPSQYFIGVAVSKMRKRIVDASAARVGLMDEILRAIKLVKMYAWEKKFADSVGELRHREVTLARIGGFLKSANLVGVFVLPPFIALSIFGFYELEANLEGTLAFTTLSMFNTLRLPLVQLPKGLRAVAEASTAVARLQAFLLAADRVERPKAEKVGITITKANYTYGALTEPLLTDISLEVPRGKLAMVAGPVGSGKSNLLQAIMGQMTRMSGTDSIGGSFAYVPQTPWCALGTVRDNILFGKPWNETWYRRVLFACALETDMALMEHGDLTQIGERGMNLSGGQKQRIALARAAYSGADVYLLDAPLSAVDMYTCVHIFKHCIKGIMTARGGTVVLVTHQVELFKDADILAVMNQGAFAFCGPYAYSAIKEFFPHAAAITDTAGILAEQAAEVAASTTSPGESQRPSVKEGVAPLDDCLNPLGRVLERANTLRAELLRTTSTTEGRLRSSTGGSESEVLAARSGAGGGAAPSSELVLAPFGTPTPDVSKGAQEAPSGYKALFFEMRPYWIFISLCIYVITQLTRIYSDIWISMWVARDAHGEDGYYVGVYAAYVASFFVFLLMRGLFFYWMGLRAATRMHRIMFASVLRAPMAFFTTTPLGHVLSTFAKDMDSIDEALLDNIHMVLIYLMILGTTLGVVIKVLPVFAAVAGGLFLSFAIIFYFYVHASQSLKDLSATAGGSVVAQVSETLQGADVISAYKAEDRFRQRNAELQDMSALAGFNLEMLQLWLAFRLDLIGCLLVLGTCLLALALKSIPAAQAGLAVSNSFQILLFFSLMVKGAADINANISSVERVKKLSDIPSEKDLTGVPSAQPSAGWPMHGEVTFHGVVMSYMPTAPHVLKGVDFVINRGEKIGVAGRTGAGKSSLIMCIFRLAEVSEGAVRIDGVDVKMLSLSELRKRIAIIPQEPVMFRGTLRSNLDPFHEKSNEDLMAAMDACLLGDTVRSSPEGLGMEVAHMGANFSLGQQQLLGLARAMLNPSKLLMLDEATAALDSDTDAAVQRVLRTNFADRTMITIAHRLDTIIDSDRILVMDAGRVAEFDSPYTLLNRPSIFSELCRQTGGQYEALRAAAERHHLAMRALQEKVVEMDVARLEELESLEVLERCDNISL